MIRGRLTAGRIEIDHGLDLTRAESLTGLTSMNVIKFASGCYIGSNYTTGEWSKGIKIKDTLSEGTLSGSEYKGKYASVVTIEGNTTSTRDGHTQGAALRVDFTRETAYTHTGGSEDIAVRFNATNYATLTSGGIRAVNIETINRTGIVASVQGMLVTAHQRTTGGFTTGLYGARIVSKDRSPSVATGYVHALIAADESDGVMPSENSIVLIQKHSNSYTAATKAGIEIVNEANTTYAQVITNGIYFKCGATNSNITNALGFDSVDYTDGFYGKGSTITCSNLYGAIKINGGGTTYYIPCYTTAS
jgi:hypothetical protein